MQAAATVEVLDANIQQHLPDFLCTYGNIFCVFLAAFEAQFVRKSAQFSEQVDAIYSMTIKAYILLIAVTLL